MTLRTVFTINAVVALFFGLLFFLIPAQLIEFYGVEYNTAGALTGRLFGATSIAFAVMTWMARPAGPSQARTAMVYGLFVGFTLGFIASLIGQLGGEFGGLGWTTVIIYFLFALDYGYFAFIRKEG